MNTVLTQNRVSAASAKLPADVTKYGVTTKKSLPNIMLALTLKVQKGIMLVECSFVPLEVLGRMYSYFFYCN